MTKSITDDGTSQDDRLPAALKGGYFNVDERRFEHLLAMAGRYARLLQYRNENNQPEGDWTPFFESDEVTVIASILSTDLGKARADYQRFARIWDSTARGLRSGDVDMSAVPAVALARKINAWYAQLGALSSVAAVRAHETIGELIDKTLKQPLHSLFRLLEALNPSAAQAGFREFDPIWGLTGGVERVRPPVGDNPQPADNPLKWNFHAFHNAIQFLQESMPALLETSLRRSNHDPAMGLFIAFLRLFAKVQHRVNGFTQNHLKFYYGDVLKVSRREAVPDYTFLIFSPDVPGRKVRIGKGTEFKAGVDDKGAELSYVADNELVVTDAKVTELHTLYLDRDKLSSPENALSPSRHGGAPVKQFPTAIKLNRIECLGKHAAGDAPASQPLFGNPRQHGKKLRLENARVGFAVASNALLLKQGRRDITFTFKVAHAEGTSSLDAFVRRLSEILSTTQADAFFKAFRRMFVITLTSETGWLQVDEYLPSCRLVDEGCDDDCLRIQFRLPDSAGAVVAYTPAVHGENYDTDLPVVKFTVNPEAYLYPYGLLCQTLIKEIAIEVEVTGHTDVLLYNQTGQLNADAQFMPFGPMPTQGDYFIVGCYEAGRKKLTGFELDVEWGGLPPHGNGFGEYYGAYRMAFDTQVFKGQLSVLRDRKWMPGDEAGRPETELFESEKVSASGKNGICKRRRLSFEKICRFLRPLEDVTEERYAYDVLSKDGFFRISLHRPHYAFGHKDYPLVLSKVMSENARLARFVLPRLNNVAPKPLPNPPYTPTINAITVNYKAVARISLERMGSGDELRLRDRMFHLHPFGIEALSPSAHGRIHLVPPYGSDGALMIGISASAVPEMLTLFFHLRDDSSFDAQFEPSAFTWHYLASNQWKKLEPRRVASDTTHGFLSSGIVALHLPPDVNRDNTIVPAGLFWLKVSADDQQLEGLCSVHGVYAQAVKVSRKQDANALSCSASILSAGAIKSAKTSIPGIAEIRQITASSGGVPAESDEQWTVRVSERLKHKNRAVTPWDYERLILERFPEIHKVKCFPCMSGNEVSGGKIAPGHLLIVVIPFLKESASMNLQPTVSALVLRQVREFIEGMSSAFATIRVRNPTYEQIQVRCTVKFRKDTDYGVSLNRLNQDISDYLSPWSAVGHNVKFGWRVRCNDIQSHIHGFDYVESVGGLSIVDIREAGEGKHRLSDTARQAAGEIRPSYPWSIAIPFPQHLIEVVTENGIWQPVATGISDLVIGSSFIVSRG